MIPIEEVSQISLYKEKMYSFNVKNKILKIGDKIRTSVGIGVPADQSTSKNHSYFYTHRFRVIQKSRFS